LHRRAAKQKVKRFSVHRKQKPGQETDRAFLLEIVPATSKPKLYNLRHPERTLRHPILAEQFEAWLELTSAFATPHR
jgi:hypothetical protein